MPIQSAYVTLAKTKWIWSVQNNICRLDIHEWTEAHMEKNLHSYSIFFIIAIIIIIIINIASYYSCRIGVDATQASVVPFLMNAHFDINIHNNK